MTKPREIGNGSRLRLGRFTDGADPAAPVTSTSLWVKVPRRGAVYWCAVAPSGGSGSAG